MLFLDRQGSACAISVVADLGGSLDPVEKHPDFFLAQLNKSLFTIANFFLESVYHFKPIDVSFNL